MRYGGKVISSLPKSSSVFTKYRFAAGRNVSYNPNYGPRWASKHCSSPKLTIVQEHSDSSYPCKKVMTNLHWPNLTKAGPIT